MTYNRKELLRECLTAVLFQTRPPDHVLVVDNASTDGTREMLKKEFPQVEVLALPENQGGAGGFHEGMKKAYEDGYDWIWVMDDDAFPDRKTLERLLVQSCYSQQYQVLVPLLRSSDGRWHGVGYWREGRYRPAQVSLWSTPFPIDVFTFNGPLFHRRVIENVGLPRREFFLWFDDTDYALRIGFAGFQVLCVPDALVHTDIGRIKRMRFLCRAWEEVAVPPEKLYYDVRNRGFTLLNGVYRGSRWRSLAFYIAWNLHGLIKDLFIHRQDWSMRVRFRLLGLRDAFLGRLGKGP
ncbi:glycosyltransferase family 2 protein [Thermus sp. PS18]|uniref:glycosyltransferase family 2 protein n=1 Tax=Thermus sp. PS18 TaxID=2849039 RepID=UPI003A5C79F6